MLRVPFAAPTPRQALRPGDASASFRIVPASAGAAGCPRGLPVLSSVVTMQTLDNCKSLPACAWLQVLLAAQSASRSRLPRAASVPVDRARAASPRTAAARGVYPQLSSHGRKLEKMSKLVRSQPVLRSGACFFLAAVLPSASSNPHIMLHAASSGAAQCWLCSRLPWPR